MRDIGSSEEARVRRAERFASHRGDREEDAVFRGELVEPRAERALERERKVRAVRLRACELHEEERVPLRARDDLVVAASGQLRQVPRLVRLEALELDEEAVSARPDPRGLREF